MKTETGNHSPNESPTWAEPPQRQPRERAAGLAHDEAEGVRLVGRDPVDPERGGGVGGDCGDRHGRAGGEAGARRRIPAGGESLPPGNEGDRHEGGERGAAVEPVQDVERSEPEQQPDREPLRAPLSPREAARDQHQREAERCDERARERMDALRRQRLQQGVGPLRQHRVDHSDQAGDGHRGREQQGRARARRAARPAEQRAAQSGEHRRQVDGAQRRSGGEGVVRLDLANGEERDADGQVAPEPDAEREQRGRRQAFGAERRARPGRAGGPPQATPRRTGRARWSHGGPARRAGARRRSAAGGLRPTAAGRASRRRRPSPPGTPAVRRPGSPHGGRPSCQVPRGRE